jgi:phosphatidylinositol dimannoside acyltransferase
VNEAWGTSTRERVAFLAYATVAWLGRVLPTTTGRVLFRWAGTAAFHALPKVRAVVAANQAQVLGRPVDDPFVRAATLRAFHSYARYWYDSFDVATWDDDRIRAAMPFDGLDRVRKLLDDGQGVLAVVPHMGNWDAAGRALAAHGVTVLSVAERLRPEALYELFLRHRRELGMEIIGLVDDGDVARKLTNALRDGRFVALVADRDLSGGGVDVEMFGRRRKLPAGPAVLALRSGAPVVVAEIYETPDGWRCTLNDPIEPSPTGDRRADVESLTREIASGFELGIAASPPDWHLFQPGWPP